MSYCNMILYNIYILLLFLLLIYSHPRIDRTGFYVQRSSLKKGISLKLSYSTGHLLVITGYKWDYTIYKWGYKYL